MHLRQLKLRNKVVLLVALGGTLWVLGEWIVVQASPFGGFGWTGYAPLTLSNGSGLHPWVQALMWLGLIFLWTVAALLLLREPKPSAVEFQDSESSDGDN